MKYETLFLTTLGIIAGFVICVVLVEFQALLLPFAVAVLFAILFHPVVIALKQRRVPVVFSLLAVLGLLGVTMLILGDLLYASALPLIQGLPEYASIIESIVRVNALEVAAEGLRIVTAALGDKAGVIGAAALVRDKSTN